MSKKKSIKKKPHIRNTASGRKLLLDFAVVNNISDPDKTVDDYIELKSKGGKTTKLEDGGNIGTAPVGNIPIAPSTPIPAIPEPTLPDPITPAPLAAQSPIPDNGLAGQPLATPAPLQTPVPSVGNQDTQIIEAIATHKNGEVPVSKMVEILKRLPQSCEQIGSILIEKVPFAQRWRLKK